ncbi:MAG: amidase [Deltaproteobacteria bacterium]|nr:amidase [Deltaproteobacteria bacterium]
MTALERLENLRSGRMDLIRHLEELCGWIERLDPEIHALVPGTARRDRIMEEAGRLLERFRDPAQRPPLFGLTLGVKDIFRVTDLPTRCGSSLPSRLFEGPEAECVTRLRKAGAIIMGKTVTTEFAGFEPGPTRNPRNPLHTPGGSSSGSAAGVAMGLFAAALGTQTVGSITRPAAYCGVIGFKPTSGRIPNRDLIPYAPNLDQVGFFVEDLSILPGVSSSLLDGWRDIPQHTNPSSLLLGIPQGPYLEQACPEERRHFEYLISLFEGAGFSIRRYPLFRDIREINELHGTLSRAEFARVHAGWFSKYRHLYRPRTLKDIEKGQKKMDDRELGELRARREKLRRSLLDAMDESGVDFWLTPSATQRAPRGLSSTGSPLMNLPWTFLGLPTLSLPASLDREGLPHGLQVVGRLGRDEILVAAAPRIAALLSNRL